MLYVILVSSKIPTDNSAVNRCIYIESSFSALESEIGEYLVVSVIFIQRSTAHECFKGVSPFFDIKFSWIEEQVIISSVE
ncbi:hypothetical protein NIES4072_36960 [Nostoc commune NIES-4072]|uniref:Uncharacterized protein n=1 Tax=Nostoc commune NIES-4072 TaxID=2005467 RepID=A0A2R5FML5_NOSCO|nr:hypothetical protein [Nostoc commune]BBD68972.1 hypothetical protein NIES4070_53800 [Nostoc commune HK-02]GBG20027.1 hypothetical protein NIES4072_36960 [Nostoc commune NIES-4072]